MDDGKYMAGGKKNGAGEGNGRTGTHRIVMNARKTALISGVLDVLSFDTKEVLLETELGILLLRGDDLHVNRLTLEKGEVDLDGRIDSLSYSENNHLTGEDGFFKKLFK